MGALRAFARLTSIYVVGEVLVLAGGLISFPIFTRLLRTDEYGLMTLVLSTVAFTEIAATLGLRHAAIRLFYAYEKRGEGALFTNTVVWGSVLLGLIGTLLVAVGGGILAVAGWLTTEAALLLATGAGLVVIRITTKILSSFYRLKEHIKAVTVVAVLVRYVGMVLAIVMVAAHDMGIFGFFIGLLLGEAGVLGCFLVVSWREIGLARPQLRWPIFRDALDYGFPLTVSSAGGAVLGNGDRFVVGHFLGAESVALYAVPYNLCAYVSGLLVAAYEFAFVPMIMQRWEAGRQEDARFLASSVIKLYALVAVPMIVALSVEGEAVLAVLASPKYRSAAAILGFVAVGEMLKGVITPLTIGLQFAKRTGTLALMSWLGAVFNIVLNFILVPRVGLMGAAVATLLSYLVVVVGGALLSEQHFSIRLPWRAMGECVLSGGAMYAALRLLAGEPLWLWSVGGGIAYVAFLLTISADFRSTAMTVLRRKGA